jgi:hypothetical protein
MRATLLTEKSSWLSPVRLEQNIDEPALAIEPIQDQIVPPLGAHFSWNAVPNATHYIVQASRFSSFSFKQLDVVTTDTFVIAGQLSPNLKYYWRIRPFNDWHACAPFGELSTFVTAPLVSTLEPDADGWRCYPSQLSDGTALTLEIPETWRGEDAQCTVYDAAGRLVWQSYQSLHASRIKLELPAEQWSAGIYHLIVRSKQGVKRAKLVR